MGEFDQGCEECGLLFSSIKNMLSHWHGCQQENWQLIFLDSIAIGPVDPIVEVGWVTVWAFCQSVFLSIKVWKSLNLIKTIVNTKFSNQTCNKI